MSRSNAIQETLPNRAQRDLARQTAIPLRKVLLEDIDHIQPSPVDKPLPKPFLIVMTGLPGTGKSHFAKKLRTRLPLLVMESDRLRKALVPNPKYTAAESARLFAACHLLIEEFLRQGRRVLFDATNLTEKFRQPLHLIARRTGAPLLIVRCTAPREVVRSRLSERGAGAHPSDYSDAGWLIYSRMSPYEEAVQGRHLNVDSSQDISGAVEEVVRLVWSGAPDHS